MDGSVQFGRYTLVRKIATGGMAEIFLAKQPGPEDFERFVVIKRILPHLTEKQEFVTMFVDEMRIAAFLSHPNIVQIHDIGSVDGQYFIAMEYLEGRDLRRTMRKVTKQEGTLPLGFVLCALARVCEGLHYAHKRKDNKGQPVNIIHRDVSPQNVMVTVQGAVKLLDFGIAKANTQLTETRSGVLKGKYSYMSPEQASGQPLDHRSDIFPLGTMLHELTTGRRLFQQGNEVMVLKQVADAEVPLPSDIDPTYPPDLERIVMKALARNPSDRYSSCQQFQRALEEFVLRRRLLQTPAAMGAYVSELFADELDEIEPESIMPEPAKGQVISFLDGHHEDEPTNPTGFERQRDSGGTKTGVSQTSSLSVLIQRARRRPGLTLGIASSLSVLVLLVLFVTALGLSGTGEEVPSPVSEEPGVLDFSSSTDDLGVSFGTLIVESTPPGARVYIDGELQEERAPVSVGAVVVGEEHFVVAEMDGATAQAERVTLDHDGDFRTVSFDFSRSTRSARVTFETLPPGATVEIDGQTRESGNYSLQPGVLHTVVVNLHGEELLHEEVRPASGDTVRLRIAPVVEHNEPRRPGGRGIESRGTGTLSLSSRPQTTAYLGSRALGQTPIRVELRAGSHNLKLVNRSLLVNYRLPIRVGANKTLERSVEIPQGQLRVSARPFAEVGINGVQLGRTPLRRVLYAGTYSVVLTNQRLNKRERRIVRIRSGSNETVRVDWR